MAAALRKSTLPLPSLHPDGADESTMSAIGRMAEAAGAPPTRLMADFAQLAVGPGRIDFADFERLRLYDDAFWGSADRRRVVGVRRAHELAQSINFRQDCFALATDRLALNAYLSAHGLPTAPVLAVYRPGLATPGRSVIRTRDELRSFLEGLVHEPLVVQPAEGGRPRLLFATGLDPAAEIDKLLDEVRDAGEVSWLIQPHLPPHPDAVADGQRLSPVRFLTLLTPHGPGALRALSRLGGRDDIVGCLDIETGAVLAIFPAAAPHRVQLAPSGGVVVPDWKLLKATAVEGARLMGQFGMLGWDVAPTVEGPVILGVDPTPDVELHQLADRQGLIDAWFQDYVVHRRRLAAEHRRLS